MESPTIKSFKLRGTRITSAQIDARQRLWSQFGVTYNSQLMDLRSAFPLAEKVVMEIGFGMGEATIEIARNFPTTGFLANDVHQPGIGKLLSLIEENSLGNVRVMDEDAHLILSTMIGDHSLDGINLFFPDPWPKTRHHKRRIINQEFIALAASKLKSGAMFNIATDWEPYAHWMVEAFATSPDFHGGIVPRPQWRPLTRFEGQGLRKNHKVNDLSYLRK